MISRVVRGKIFNPLGLSQYAYYPDGAVLVDAAGRIIAVGGFSELAQTHDLQQAAVADYRRYLILPGLIDTHLHLPQLPICGITAGTLPEWLIRHAYPVEERFADPDYARRLSYVFFQSLKANGTTTALVMSSVHEESTRLAFQAAAESGLRILMGKVMMNHEVPDALLETTEASAAASRRLAQEWHGACDGLLHYAFTPRYLLSCTPDLLEAAAGLQAEFPGSYLHSHLAENVDEVRQAEAAGTGSYAARYHQHGCLGGRTVMAHGIHLHESDFSLLKSTGTAVAHCPTSNFFLKSGVFPLMRYRDWQIPVGLGSDVGAGPELSLFKVMRAMDDIQVLSQRFVSPVEALYTATLGGAEALSLQNETGNFAPGKSADYIVVDTAGLSAFPEADTAESIEGILSLLVYRGQASHILETWVRGRRVYRQAKLSE